ncbi:MAG: hypothetical protein ACR2OR_05890 [Hyphomicrobiales bacterium]
MTSETQNENRNTNYLKEVCKRGERLTKYKGIAASYAPYLTTLMLSVSAAALTTVDTANAQIINNGGIGSPCVGGSNFVTALGQGAGYNAGGPNPYTGNQNCVSAGGPNGSSYVGYQTGGAAWGDNQSAIGPNAAVFSVGNDLAAFAIGQVVYPRAMLQHFLA